MKAHGGMPGSPGSELLKPPTLFSGIVHLWCESASVQVCEPENAHVLLHPKSWQEQCVPEQPCASGLLCFYLAFQEPSGCLINTVTNLRTSSSLGERGKMELLPGARPGGWGGSHCGAGRVGLAEEGVRN